MLEIAFLAVGALTLMQVPLVAQILFTLLHAGFKGLDGAFVARRKRLVETVAFCVVVCPFLLALRLGFWYDGYVFIWWNTRLADGGPGGLAGLRGWLRGQRGISCCGRTTRTAVGCRVCA